MNIAPEKKTFIVNVLQNAVATAIPLIALQLFVLPKISEQMSPSAYGLMLTLVSVISLVTTCSGASLNDVRLLMNLDYEEKGFAGDFNILISILTVLGATVVGIFTAIYSDGAGAKEIAGMVIIGVLAVLYQYYLVGFRLALSYGKIAINSVIQTAGYLIGYWLFRRTNHWQWVYIMGYGLSDAYILLSTKLIHEPWKRTPLFTVTSAKEAVLLVSSLLNASISYIDRLLLYPILGGEAVTVYYVATLFGKMVCVAVNPVTGVMLSFFSKMKRLKMDTMTKLLLASAAVGAAAYAGCILVSRPILAYLYPQVVDAAMHIIYIATLTCVVDMVASVVSPVVLRFCNTNWQLAIGAFNVASYLAISLTMLSLFGLPGFCLGVLIASLLKLLLMVLVYIRSDRKQKREEAA